MLFRGLLGLTAATVAVGLHTLVIKKTAAKEEEGGGDGECSFCGKLCTLRCACCKDARYCSVGCQHKHWQSGHKYKCIEREIRRGTHDQKDDSCTVDNWLDFSMEEFSLLPGCSPGDGNTNLNDIKRELIWKLRLPAKLISFLGKICMNVVPLGDKQTKGNLRLHGNCPFGCPAAEDLDHLFMECPLSRAVWFGSTLKLKIENISPASIQFWILSVLVRLQQDQTGKVRAFLEWITCVCWCIYQHRNAVIFRHQQPSPAQALHHLTALVKKVNNIHHKHAQPPCPKTSNSQETLEQTDKKMAKNLEEELAKSNNETILPKSKRNKGATPTSSVSRRHDTFMEASDEHQNAGKARDAERILQEEIIQILKTECAKLKRELEKEQKLVQRLKLKEDNEAEVTKRKVEKIGQELANARKNVEYVSTRAHDAENKWIKAKRELQEKQQLVQLLKRECKETRQSAKRQAEEKELELTNALIDAGAAESRAVAAEAKLSNLEGEIKSSGDKACAICLINEKDTAFGCGHMSCGDCGLRMSICPICRKKITRRLRLFPG